MPLERMKKQKEETYRQILDTAWDIAIREGLEAVSIRKIASALGFAPNNLYNYFKDKNELLLCLKKDAYQWTFDVLGTHEIGDGESICSFLHSTMLNLLHIAEKEPERYIIMTSESILDLSEPMDKKITEYLSILLEKGIANNEFRKCNTEITAINIRIMIIGFIRMVTSNPAISAEEADTMLDNLFNIICKGIQVD